MRCVSYFKREQLYIYLNIFDKSFNSFRYENQVKDCLKYIQGPPNLSNNLIYSINTLFYSSSKSSRYLNRTWNMFCMIPFATYKKRIDKMYESIEHILTLSHIQQICSRLLWKHVDKNIVNPYKWGYIFWKTLLQNENLLDFKSLLLQIRVKINLHVANVLAIENKKLFWS